MVNEGMGMPRAEGFVVDALDYGAEVGVAFSQGEGAKRLRWGARMTPDLARRLAIALNRMADKVDPRPPSSLTGASFDGT